MFFNKKEDEVQEQAIDLGATAPEPIASSVEPSLSVDESIAVEATAPIAPQQSEDKVVADASDKDAVKFDELGNPYYVGVGSPYQDLKAIGVDVSKVASDIGTLVNDIIDEVKTEL